MLGGLVNKPFYFLSEFGLHSVLYLSHWRLLPSLPLALSMELCTESCTEITASSLDN